MDEWIDKIMNIKQQEVAQMNMVEWLPDSQELGKKPSKLNLLKNLNCMRCIIIFLNLREVYLVHGLLGLVAVIKVMILYRADIFSVI